MHWYTRRILEGWATACALNGLLAVGLASFALAWHTMAWIVLASGILYALITALVHYRDREDARRSLDVHAIAAVVNMQFVNVLIGTVCEYAVIVMLCVRLFFMAYLRSWVLDLTTPFVFVWWWAFLFSTIMALSGVV